MLKETKYRGMKGLMEEEFSIEWLVKTAEGFYSHRAGGSEVSGIQMRDGTSEHKSDGKQYM